MERIKSVIPMLRNNEWLIRVRTTEREIMFGEGARYTLHQAQTYADSVRRDIARHGIDAATA